MKTQKLGIIRDAPFDSPLKKRDCRGHFVQSKEEFQDPGIVKVVTDLHHNAIYFSRAPIPYFRVEEKAPVYHHMGLYAFRRDFLLEFCKLSQTPLEKIEALEQLRAMDTDLRFACV
jgi:CMP-2-keto-3-deoxyoctulosonic acid synthetase